MLKILFPLLVLCELAGAADVCPQIFSATLSPLQKATEINRKSGGKGVFTTVGAGNEVVRYIDRAAATANVLLTSHVYHSIQAAEMVFGKGPAVVETRLKQMLEYGLKENYEIEIASKSNDDPRIAKFDGVRRFSFANTAVTKHKVPGYMWTGVILEFRPGEFIEFRLQLSLHNIEDIESQMRSAGIFEINLLHSLMKFKDFENPEKKIDSVVKDLAENISPGDIKINDFYADRVEVKDGNVISRTPLLLNSVSAVNMARDIFSTNQARSLIIKDSKFVDPIQASYKANIVVKAVQNLGQILNVDNLKREFEEKSVSLPPQTKGNLFVVALEDRPNIDMIIARLNFAGIAVWLFKSSDVAATEESIRDRVSAKRDYIKKFSGRLYLFGEP